jgi:peptidoglycan/LPS O-acetylase OafA/YrhL
MSADARSIPYRPDIDGLRAIAVALVVVFHADTRTLPGGFVGVDVFFVISGFLISSLILEEIRANRFTLGAFYLRRVRRIVPALMAMLIVAGLAGWLILPPPELRTLGLNVLATLLFVPNLSYWRTSTLVGYFAPGSETMPLMHTWSLGVEEQFYLLFPICLAWLLRRQLSPARHVVLAAILGSFALCVACTFWRDPATAFYLFPTRAWQLLVGTWLAMAPVPTVRAPLIRNMAAFAGLTGILTAALLFNPLTVYPGYAAALPTLATALLIDANRGAPSVVGRFLALPPLVGLGQISYSLYLWHWPMLVFARWASNESLPRVQVAALMLLAVGVAVASRRFVERPFLAQPPHVTDRAVLVWAGVSVLAVGVLAFGAFHTRGHPSRYPPAARQYLAATGDRLKIFAPCPSVYRFAKNLAAICRLGSLDRRPTDVLVWGDSHAAAAAPVFMAAADETGKAGYLAKKAGCAPLTGIQRLDRDSADCAAFNAMVIALVREQRIRNVVLVAHWSTYANEERSSWGIAALHRFATRDDVTVPRTAAENLQVFTRAIGRTVGTLRELGARVFILEEVPGGADSVPSGLAKAVRYGLPRANVSVTIEEYRMLQANQALAFREVAADDPNIVIVDPIAVFCPARRCEVEENGESLYVDRHHVSRRGAMRMKPLVAEIVRSFQQ